ncbi:hypothetical protein PYCC9005_000508 [Savitreella phatthalungensis]
MSTAPTAVPAAAPAAPSTVVTSTAAPGAASASGATTAGKPAAPIIVHHLNDSRSQRILWLLEELELPYEVKRYDRVDGRAPKSLRDVHPLGKSPVITDGALTIAESTCIVNYLIAKYDKSGKFTPATEQEKVDAEYWAVAAEASFMAPFLVSLIFITAKQKAPWLARPIVGTIGDQVSKQFSEPEIRSTLSFCETTLSKHEWLVSDKLTAADFMMSFIFELLPRAGPSFSAAKYPKVFEWRKRVGARPAYQAALKRGGEDYAYKL